MHEVLDELLTVWRAGGTAGVATVVRTIKSAPRPPGATMVVAPDGTVAGSVSGGFLRPRPAFPTPTTSSSIWPDRYLAAQAEQGAIDSRTAICVLTQEPRFDVPGLQVALRLPEVDYIGVMGSRRTHDDRMDRLCEVEVTDAELSRLASPIGLDLGARTPEETAVSIAAEIIARRWGGGGRPLTEVSGRIHHD